MTELDEIRRRIVEIAPNLHTAGTFSEPAFTALARHAAARPIRRSAETGSGASTLLLSHLSRQHTVFALDAGSGSIDKVRRSPLLQPGVVTFIEGPTQITLPSHRFTGKLQLVLLDGPHAYPFPDLEYYYFYPHLDTGALLVLDDIHIRGIHNLFDFLRRDAMFALDEVVGTTAFFKRTEAPVFDPLGDGWWTQGYNAHPLPRYVWKERIRGLLPRAMRRGLSRWKRRTAVTAAIEILAPRAVELVGDSGIVEGSATLPGGSHLWVLVHRRDFDGWWPQGAGALPVDQGRWTVPVAYGGPQDRGCEFEIAALAVGEPTHELWTDWVATVQATGQFPPVQLPPAKFIQGEAFRTVTRKA